MHLENEVVSNNYKVCKWIKGKYLNNSKGLRIDRCFQGGRQTLRSKKFKVLIKYRDITIHDKGIRCLIVFSKY